MFLSQHLLRQIPQRVAANCLGMIEAGVYYGYPACCIEEFVEHRLRQQRVLPDFDPMAYQAERLCSGTGFQPCKSCNGFKTRPELEAEITRNRICKIDFPGEHAMSTNEEFEHLSATSQLLMRYVQQRPQARGYVPLLIDAWGGNAAVDFSC